MNCKNCEIKLEGMKRKFCSLKCKNKFNYDFNESYLGQQKRGIERKLFFVKQLGGKCNVCGYDKNLAVLTFHHRDPSKKKFGIDMRKMSNNSMEVLQEEVNKCQLLCHNCHMEIHYPQLKLVGPPGLEPRLNAL